MKKQTQRNFPYKTGEQSYNKESGRKTLFFVAICIVLVAIFASLSLFLLSR